MTHITKPLSRVRRYAVGSGLVCALAIPMVAPDAMAAPGPKTADYKARGIVVATDASTATVCVGTAKKSSNKRASVWRGFAVTFDLATSRVKDRLDGTLDPGDLIKVTAKLPVDLSLASSPFSAKELKVEHKKKVKLKDGFFGGVCPEWTDDEGDDLGSDDGDDGTTGVDGNY